MTWNFIMHRWCTVVRHHGIKSLLCCPLKLRNVLVESHLTFHSLVPISSITASCNLSSPKTVFSHMLSPCNIFSLQQALPIQYMSSISDSDSDDEETFDILLNDRELIKDSSEVFRSLLYPNSNDPLIQKLNESRSVQDVFIFVHRNQNNLDGTHVSQAVLVLWDLQRTFQQVCIETNPQNHVFETQKYIKAVSGHPDFHNLLRLVQKFASDLLNPDALTCTMLYLSKMNIDRSHSTMETLLFHCEKGLLSFPLTAISRFLVAVHGAHLWTVAITKSVVPLVIQQLMQCENEEHVRLLTTCLSNLHYYVTPSLLSLYKNRVQYLLNKGVFETSNPRTVVKIISFLDIPRWCASNHKLIVDLMQTLSGKVSEMRPLDIILLHRVFQSQLEPVNILEEIQFYALKMLDNQDPALFPIEMVACVVPFSSPNIREKVFEDLLVSHIKSPSFSSTMPIIFKILRYLKLSNNKIWDFFWSENLKHLRKTERVDYKLLRVSHKYMHFNNNLGGTYRHYEFEKQMMEWLVEDLHKVTGMIPTKVARIASFILGYNQTPIPSILMKKLEGMAPQFSILDCLHISRGLQIASELRYKYKGPLVVEQLVAVSSILSSCLRSHLTSSKLSLSEVNMLMRSYINIKGVSGTDVFEALMNKYESSSTMMSSRLIRDTTFNLYPHRCLVPAVMDVMVQYVTDNASSMLGDTVEKFLSFCYWLGFNPDSEQIGLKAAVAIIRDKERMTGLSVIQAAIALCFFQQLPTALIHYIFTVEFLERLDAELKLCYSKATYPLKVRQCLMELNRAVCLEYPQADVPWFHSKYCEAQATQDTVPTSTFYQEVLHALATVVGGIEFIKKNSYTPYFYKLDFEVILDEHQKPIPVKQHRELEDRQVTRIGVLLLREDAFSSRQTQLRGPILMRRRHLEILNYRQVEVSQIMWQAMYMTEDSDRQSYISKHIWPGKISIDEPSDDPEIVPV